MTIREPESLQTQPIPFEQMPGFTKLFVDYCTDFRKLAPFYAADFRDPNGYGEIADHILGYRRDQTLLADTLLLQNEKWGLDDATRENINRLRRDDALAVVTGQQVGLFGGPLYTIYKIATAVRLASELSTSLGRPVVPVFWLEGEDHDVEEVRSINLLANNSVTALSYPLPEHPDGRNHGPVGRMVLGDGIGDMVTQLEDTLPATEFRDRIVGQVREAYAEGTTIRDAFARLMQGLFQGDGLVFISPDDRRFKKTAIPLFVRDVDEGLELVERIRAWSSELEQRYHAQVTVSPTNLFLISDDGRFAIDAIEGGERFSVRGRDRVLSRSELVSLIEEDPCCISPNVVLRPILQDRLLPTLAYVGGPGEVAYFAQFKPVYEWAGQPMPVIYPRASITLVEAKVDKILSRYGLPVSAAGENPGDLFRRVVLDQMDVDLEAAFSDAASGIHQAVNAVKPIVSRVDGTLAKSVEASRALMLNEWNRLREKILKSEKRRHDEDRSRLERLQANLFPSGHLQERTLSVLYYLSKYGPELIGELTSALSLDTTAHQVVRIGS